MASIFTGYENDIFVSYRQKDNRSEQWVTNFVRALREEIDSTFKEEVSVYFDSNPHDGLLETHDVDGSLKEKIKCLIFIPIVSRTYCDTNSFAWKNEFIAFVKFAQSDAYGLNIRLLNGNVAKRVLPVRIHEIDKEDSALLEKEIRGVLRPVDFIYKEPGVNRPLRLADDRSLNLEKTEYKNQVNKIANAIFEIIRGLRTDDKLKPGQPHVQLNPIAKDALINSTKSIVVLPFENISNDPDQEYFSDGLTEEIIADLSKLSSLRVISRTSAMVFKGSKKDVRTIGQELNVRYVLEGSVRKAGNKLRITAQLIDAPSDAYLWAEKFNGVLDDVFDIQEKVSRAIVESLRLELTPQERARLTEKSPVDPAARELYLGGRYHLNRATPYELTKAVEQFEYAIRKDPSYALAYAGMANAYNYLGWLGRVAGEVFTKAKQAAAKALEIDETIAEAHAVLGYAATFYDWDWATAERELQRAIALNPNYAEGYLHYSWYLGSQERHEEARAAIERASELDPLSLVIHANMANYYQWKRDYDGALSQTQRVLELAPNFPLALLFSGMAYWGKEQYDDAARMFGKLVELAGPGFKGYLGYSYAKAGRKESAMEILDEMKVRSKTEHVPSFQIALVLLGLGWFEEALTWLEKAFGEREGAWFPYIRQESFFDPLRGYPHFQDLVAQLNFPER
jgi:TolB-like protein/Tfp pilus assembly protein PilF